MAPRPHTHKNLPTPSPTRPHTRQASLRAEVVELSEAQVADLKRAQAEEAQRLIDGNAAWRLSSKSERCVLEIYPDKPSNDSEVYKCPRCNFHNLYRGGACNKLCCGNKTCNELFCIKCFKPAHMLCAHMLAAHMHAW